MAVLGPAGTFSERAAEVYKNRENQVFEKKLFTTIEEVFFSVEKECDYGIIPLENTLDGYVQRTIDLLFKGKLKIIGEVLIPIQFAFIGNSKSLEEIKQIFVQFKANGQCRKFLNQHTSCKLITTESNVLSYESVLENRSGDGAIIPFHLSTKSTKRFTIENITDSESNYTRFLILEKNSQKELFPKVSLVNEKDIWKVSLFVIPKSDEPGILFDILSSFSEKKINLCSIMSRPTKKQMGKYNFYMELDGNSEMLEKLKSAIMDIEKNHKIKIVGIYKI